MSGPTADTADQKTALAIADTLEKAGTGVWPFIDPKDLADSLRQRILAPTKINQATMPACAPAAIAVNLAIHKPVLFAEAISGLYRQGFAFLPGIGFDGDWLVASERLRKTNYNTILGVRSPKEQPAADWILLSSIRNSESWLNIYWGSDWPFGWISGMTLPSTFEKWLHGVGYTRSVNKTNLLFTKDAPDLMEASDLFDKGWRVFIFVNANCLKKRTQSDRSVTPDHYIPLISKVTLDTHPNTGGALNQNALFTPQCVNFLTCSWGKPQRVPADQYLPLSIADFCKNFYGFVAAID
ncbi:MAG: hypothetical protein ABI999_10015 [Acidobacteriota bacterium]